MIQKANHRLWMLVILFTLIFTQNAYAVPAYDGYFEIRQPSGISFEARQQGDEWYHWVETKDGYGIYKNTETGNWEYYLPSTDVVTTDGSSCQIQSLFLPGGISHVLAGEGDPALYGIPKGLRPVMPLIGSGLEFSTRKSLQAELKGEQKNNPVSGTMHLLVIGVEYTDAPATYTAEQIQPLLFGASNSVSDYYSKTSYSSVTIVQATESHGTLSDGFIGWLRLGDKHPNPGRNKGIIAARKKHKIAKKAIIAADPYIDYSSYDANGNGIIEPTELSIIIIVAGYEASSGYQSPSVWGHQDDIRDIRTLDFRYPSVDGKTIKKYAMFGEKHEDHLATIGVMCHELGHLMFSLPDLYDTDKDNGDSYGVGDFDLMGNGSWGAQYEEYAGSSPTQLSAWSKEYLSWGTVNIISTNQQISLQKSDGNQSSIFRINTSDSNQYFLIENRQLTGYDIGFQRSTRGTGHGGLVIYHIDKLKTDLWPKSNTVNADENDKGVDIEEANEGSLGYSRLDDHITPADTKMFFFLDNNKSFTDSTVPNSKLKNGDPTNISITDISIYGDTMTAMIALPGTSNTTPTPSTTVTPSPTPTPTTTTKPTPSPEVTPESTPTSTPTPTTSNSFKLVFPLPNKSYDTVIINSVFDHSMTKKFCADGIITAYSGDTANDSSKKDLYCETNTSNNPDNYSYLPRPSKIPNYNKNYTTLSYDGHPGYDFKTTDQNSTEECVDRLNSTTGKRAPDGKCDSDGGKGFINVLAAHDGTVTYGNDKFGEIIITRKANDYRTHYLHLYKRSVSSGVYVKKGDVIGVSGDTGSPGAIHLHFQVEKYLNNEWVPIDPYKWEGNLNEDPYKWAEHQKDGLWESTSSTDNPPSVSITSPANGSTVSGTVTVSADATDDNGIKRVEFYLDGTLKSTDTSSPYSWSWDTTQSTNGSHTLKAIAYDTADQTTTSQISVTVNNTTTSITVTSPNGGETLQAGSTKTISWNYTGSPGSYVKIELLKNDSTYTTITSSTLIGSSGSGSYNWMIPASQTTGSDYKVKVISNSYADTSDSNFTISASKSDLVIQNLSASPSSGSASSSATVSFTIYNQGNGTANSSTTNIRINSSSSSVSTSDTLLASISTPSISSGGTSYVNQTVTIPSSFSAGTYYIWGWADVNNTANQSDTSNDKTKTLFTISGGVMPGSITDLTATAECDGTTSQIRLNWSAASNATSYDVYRNSSLYYSGVSGTQFINSANITSGTSYSYYVQAKNSYGSTNSNTVSATAITCGTTVTVTSPNGGESWTAGSTYTIYWSVTGNTSNINYFWTAYSTDGGSSFTSISTASSSDRSLSWTIPSSVSSTQCKVRVRALDSSGYILAYDMSDSNFTITGGGSTPGSITDLTATAECDGTTSQIRLNWSAASNATSYDVYRNSSLYYSGVSGTQFINSANITSGTSYSYYVQAKNSYGSTNSNTVSATAKTCSGSTQVERVTNGSFSSGTSGWTLSGDFWAGTTYSSYRTSPGYAAGGVDSSGTAKNNAYGNMYQAVTIPSSATSATVSFWYNVTSNETGSGSYDTLNVTVQDSSGSYLATVAVLGNNDKGSLGVYSKKTLDVTSYKGQTIRIYFLATTDSNNTTTFRIDDVSLMSDGN